MAFDDEEVLRPGARPTPSERRMLDALLPGRRVSVGAMVGAVWGHRPDGGPLTAEKVLRVFAGKLRRKMRPQFWISGRQGGFKLERTDMTETYHLHATVHVEFTADARSPEEAWRMLESTLEANDGQIRVEVPVDSFSMAKGEGSGRPRVASWVLARSEDQPAGPKRLVLAESYAKAHSWARKEGLDPRWWARIQEPEDVRGLRPGEAVVTVVGAGHLTDSGRAVLEEARRLGLEVTHA